MFKRLLSVLTGVATLSLFLAGSVSASDADSINVRAAISGNARFVLLSTRAIIQHDTTPGGLIYAILRNTNRNYISSIRVLRGRRLVSRDRARLGDTIQLNLTSNFLSGLRSHGNRGAVVFEHSVYSNCSRNPQGNQAYCETNPSKYAPVTVYITGR